MERLALAIGNIAGVKTESKGYKGIELAEVNSLEPFSVIYRGAELDGDNLKIADYLIKDYGREFEIETDNMTNIKGNKFSLSGTPYLVNDINPSGTRPIASIPEAGGTTSNVEMEGTLKAKGKIKWTDTLKQGDELAVILTEDEQTLIILCKVVSI